MNYSNVAFILLFSPLIGLFPFQFFNYGHLLNRRNNIILSSLEYIIPEAIIKNILIEYDLEGYEGELDSIMMRLNGNEINAKYSHSISIDFYNDNFLINLRKLIDESFFFSTFHNDPFCRILQRLILKWLLEKKREYAYNDTKFKNLFHQSIEPLKRSILKRGGDYFHEFQMVNFLNDHLIRNLLKIECIFQWEMLISRLEMIYHDFYQNGFDRDYIIQKYFHGNLNNKPLLRFFIKCQDKAALNLCLNFRENCSLTKSYLSEKQIKEKIESNMIMIVHGHLLDEYELELITKNGHKVRIYNNVNITILLRNYRNLNILTEKNLTDSLIPYNSKTWNKEHFINLMRKNKRNYDQELWMQIERIFNIKI